MMVATIVECCVVLRSVCLERSNAMIVTVAHAPADHNAAMFSNNTLFSDI